MKDWVPVVTVGLGLAGLMLALHTQTQNQFADVRSDIEQLDNRFTSRIEALDDRLTSRIEALDGRVYETERTPDARRNAHYRGRSAVAGFFLRGDPAAAFSSGQCRHQRFA